MPVRVQACAGRCVEQIDNSGRIVLKAIDFYRCRDLTELEMCAATEAGFPWPTCEDTASDNAWNLFDNKAISPSDFHKHSRAQSQSKVSRL
jgi:hypothetical protein